MNPDSLPSFDEWLEEATRLAEDYARAWAHDVDGSFMVKNQSPKAKAELLAHLAAHPSAAPQGAQPAEPVAQKLWLWKNFVDGRPEYWAFDNPYPVNMDNGDPQTLGEPCGYALFKPSRTGRTDVSEEQVLRAIARTKAAPVAPQEVRMLTVNEILQAMVDELQAGVKHTPQEIIQRKFCEVNGLTIPAKEQP